MTENTYKIESAAISDKGLSEKRPQNEDSYLEMNARGLFAVADGVGGAQAGEVASQMAVEILGEAFNNLKPGGDAEELMRVAIERANQSIFQMSHDLAELATMATTVVALHVAGNIATIGHVGDSRLYRLDSNGVLYRETQDHSVVEEEVRAGRMTEAQAVNHPSRNIISRALGADLTVEVDLKTIMFEPNTTFLLCSDGITRHITDLELRELLRSGDALGAVAQKMKQICYERGAEDNLTAVIAKITAAEANKTAVPENFAAAAIEPARDLEESTVATARAASSSVAAPIVRDTAPLENQPEHFSAVQSGEVIPNSDIDDTQGASSRDERAPDSPPAPAKIEIKPAQTIEIETTETGSSGKLRKFLSALLWLIIGGLAGAGIYYLFEKNNRQPETAVLAPQSENINLTSFEKARRDVDRNPQQYLASAAAPEDAEDFYLLGRANLYGGKFAEAKQNFSQAKDRLAQTSEVNSKVLSDDIETGLIIVGVPFALTEFKKAMNLNQTNQNTDANQAAENR